MRTRRTLAQVLGFGALIALYSPHPVADACGIAGPSMPTRVLGLDERRAISETLVLPSNAAGLTDLGGETFSVAGVTLTRIPEGASGYDVRLDVVVPVSDTPDLVAPRLDGLDAAVVTEVTACSGCAYGGIDESNLTLSLRASDDLATFEQLSVAVYLGETAEEATTAAALVPDVWTMADPVGAIWVLLAPDDTSRFVVVRVFDQAGNASEASAPVSISS